MAVLGGRTTEGEYGDIVATVVAKMMPKSAQVRGHRGHNNGPLSRGQMDAWVASLDVLLS